MSEDEDDLGDLEASQRSAESVEEGSGEAGEPGEDEGAGQCPDAEGKGRSRKGKGKGTGTNTTEVSKQQAKAIKATNESGKGSARNKATTGKKYCLGCDKTHMVEEFPPGSGQCGPIRQAVQNARKAALAQGQGGWWTEVQDDWEKLRPIVQYYMEQCPKPPAGSTERRKTFDAALYIDHAFRESALSYEGIYDMMSGRQYCVHMGKPEQGS